MSKRHSGCAFVLFIFFTAGCAIDAGPTDLGAPREAEAKNPKIHSRDLMTGPWRKLAVTPRIQTPNLAAYTALGEIAIVDGETGAVKTSTPGLGLSGGRDLVYDPWGARVLVFEGDPAGPDGEIAAYPIAKGSASLGARVHLASQQGDARLVASPSGAIVCSDADDGAQWSVIGNGAAVAAPRPMSAWIGEDGGKTALFALAYGPAAGELDTVRAAIHGSVIGTPSITPLAIDAGSLPASARVVPAPARGGALLVDVEGSFLTVRRISGSSVSEKKIAPLGTTGERIEGAAALHGGAVVALQLSGATEVMAVEIGPDLAPASMAKIALPGQPALSTKLLSHDLVAQGASRVAAATSAGVFSIAVSFGPSGVRLTLVHGFDGAALRGPLAAIEGG